MGQGTHIRRFRLSIFSGWDIFCWSGWSMTSKTCPCSSNTAIRSNPSPRFILSHSFLDSSHRMFFMELVYGKVCRLSTRGHHLFLYRLRYAQVSRGAGLHEAAWLKIYTLFFCIYVRRSGLTLDCLPRVYRGAVPLYCFVLCYGRQYFGKR